jgi:NAD(P)H-dependent FMN reductase
MFWAAPPLQAAMERIQDFMTFLTNTSGQRPTLLIIIASTRPGRVGGPVGQWIREQAQAHGAFQVEVADLAEIQLPFMDEPNHPRLGQYVHQHTKHWSARVAAADAFIMVTPEYNYGFTAPLKNAIDYLHREWQHKPVGLVSYGGIAAGTRSAQMLKQVLTALKMMPLTEAVAIPFVNQLMDANGQFQPTPSVESSAQALLDELARVTPVLATLRAQPVPAVAAPAAVPVPVNTPVATH